jgi:hypothetical protein
MLQATLTRIRTNIEAQRRESDSSLDDLLATSLESSELISEKKLMLAVLNDAIACLEGVAQVPSPQRAKFARDARDWFLEKKDYAFFSFENVCETLALDRQAIRDALHVD